VAAFFGPVSFTTQQLTEDAKLLACQACGALVPMLSQNPHRSFHAAIDRMNEDHKRTVDKLRRLEARALRVP